MLELVLALSKFLFSLCVYGIGELMADKKEKKKEKAPEPPARRRPCFVCDGTGEMCDCCGESIKVCECEEDDKSWVSCKDCNGHGIASADLTEEEKSGS